MYSKKDRVSVVHLSIALSLLLLQLVAFHPGCCLPHEDDDRGSCSLPRSLGCLCSHDRRSHRIYIKCEDVRMTEVPRNFSHPQSLRMTRTGLKLDDGVPYRSLTDLRIESNAIPRIKDGAFERLEKLITLILVDNRMKVLTGRTFAGLRSLEFLSLAGNAISHVKAEVFSGINMPRLKILKLSDCGISSLDPHSFSALQNLAMLDLSANRIERLPVLGDGEGLPSLTTLELSSNRLKAISGSTFQHLSNVHHLHLSHNRISTLYRDSFPSSMCTTLLSLYLRYNGLELVETSAIGQLESLTTLDISFNNLKTLAPDDVPDNIEKILIHDNPWLCMNCENEWILQNPRVRDWNEDSSVKCGWPHIGRSFFNSSRPSDCDDHRPPTGQHPPTVFLETMTLRNEARPRFYHVVWISTSCVLAVLTIIAAVIYVYARCSIDRWRLTSKTYVIKRKAAESTQCLVTDDID